MRFILVILFVLSYAQEIAIPDENIKDLGKGWYEVTAFEEIINITPEQARQKAIDRAYKLAVKMHSDIEISTVKMREKLCIVKGTCTGAIHKLITVGLIRLTRESQNKICHKYKILYQIVPTNEQRWKKYPDKNWAHKVVM